MITSPDFAVRAGLSGRHRRLHNRGVKMKRLFVAGVITVAAAAVSGTVAAAPPGLDGDPPPGLLNKGDTYLCDETESVVFGGNGRSGWLDGTMYQAVEALGSWTFTPVGGDPIGESWEKTWGKGPKSGEVVHCTQSDSGSDAEGEWSYESTVTAVKVPGF
jgi:hypothetical protein